MFISVNILALTPNTMKTYALCIATLLFAGMSAQADNVVQKLWEHSEATSSKPSVIGTSDIRDFDYHNGSIYIQDKENQQLHRFSKDGIFEESLNSGAYHIINFDHSGNLIFCNASDTKMELKSYNFNTQTLNSIYTLGMGVHIDHPTIWGDLKTGIGYIYGIPSGSSLFRITTHNGIPSGYNISMMSSYASDINYTIPVNNDSVIICLGSNKIFYYDITNDREGDVLLQGSQKTESIGGSYFEYKGQRYLVQAYQSGGNHLGAFKIYNITNPNDVFMQYDHPTNLGSTDNTLSKAVHFETEVKPDGVYIYQFVPKNGIAAYKLYDESDTKVEAAKDLTNHIYSYEGKLFISDIIGEKVTIYNLQGGKLYEATVNGDMVISNLPINEIVIIKTTNQALKISIR